MNDKLQRGLRQLAEAGHDNDKLGMALMSLHRALEEFFRSQLAAEITVDENEQGRRRSNWQDLLNLWQTYRTLSHHDRELIYATNAKRNAAAHGDPYEISRNEVEFYAQFVKKFMGIPLSYEVVANPPMSKAMREEKASMLRLKLLINLTNHFNMMDLRVICFELNVDHEKLPQTKTEFIMALIEFLENRNRIEELVIIGKREREFLDWD